MNFTLQSESYGRITFPVNPQDYTVSVSHKNTVTNVIQKGDINLIGKTGLRGVSLSSFFPAQDYAFGASIGDPVSIVEQIDSWRKSGSTCRIIIGRTLNMECTIEKFDWSEKDYTGDIYFTLELKEYNRIGLSKVATTSNMVDTISDVITTEKRETKEPETGGRKYTVKSGDSLWKIAKQFYGDGAEYKKIWDANSDVLYNPDHIRIGQVLIIP